MLGAGALGRPRGMVWAWFNLHKIYRIGDTLLAQMVKYLSAMQETQVQFLGGEDPLEKE